MPKWTRNNASASNWLKLLGVTLMLLPMAACAMNANGTKRLPVDTSCAAFRPITYSKTDSPETVKEVRAHNRVYDALCPSVKGPS